MALHEFQIAEVDIENTARPALFVDQLDDHPGLVNSCVIANDTLRPAACSPTGRIKRTKSNRRARSVVLSP
jgi:hypothetical protein